MQQRFIIVRVNLRNREVCVFRGYKSGEYENQWRYLYNADEKDKIPNSFELSLLIHEHAEDMTQGEAALAMPSFELDKKKWSYDILPLQSHPF